MKSLNIILFNTNVEPFPGIRWEAMSMAL